VSDRAVYFHEDDFCQIEVLPAENSAYCARELDQIAEFSAQHRAPDGVGWTDVYPRGEAQKKLADLLLSADRASGALAEHLPEFDRVETGYGSHVEQCRGIRAFGFDRGCVVFMSETETRYVRDIWLGLDGPDESATAALVAALGKLSGLAPLILVDWGWERVIALGDSASLDRYCAERRERFRQMHEEMQRQRELRTTAKKPWWRFW
jgi:hypothetical protein